MTLERDEEKIERKESSTRFMRRRLKKGRYSTGERKRERGRERKRADRICRAGMMDGREPLKFVPADKSRSVAQRGFRFSYVSSAGR